MKKITSLLATALFSANAFACPVSDALAKRYGISFSGFDTPIPAAEQAPVASGEHRLLRLPLASGLFVSDGFRHTVVLDPVSKKAWILRTGGFAGVHEWYGPVDAGDAKLENCRSEPELVVKHTGNN